MMPSSCSNDAQPESLSDNKEACEESRCAIA